MPFFKVYGILLLATGRMPPRTLAQEAMPPQWAAVFPNTLNPQQPALSLFTKVTLSQVSSASDPSDGSAAPVQEGPAANPAQPQGNPSAVQDAFREANPSALGAAGVPVGREKAIEEQPSDGKNVIRILGTGGPPTGRASGF